MPRCRTMIDPAVTNWPSPALQPRRWPTLSRPFLELEPAFLWAIGHSSFLVRAGRSVAASSAGLAALAALGAALGAAFDAALGVDLTGAAAFAGASPLAGAALAAPLAGAAIFVGASSLAGLPSSVEAPFAEAFGAFPLGAASS